MTEADVGGVQGIRALTTPVPGVDRRFERVFTLTLATGGEADAVALDLESARLRGAFVARTFDALASVGLLRGVPLIAHPVNPALLVGLAGAQEAPVLVWAGAVEDTTTFDAGAALAGEIQRLLDALPTPLPPTIALALSARADESCAVKVEDIALPYELVTRRFAAIPLRRTDVADPQGLLQELRFPSGTVTAHLRTRLDAATLRALENGGEPLDRVLADLDAVLAGALWDPALFAEVALTPAVGALAAEGATGERRTLLNRALLEAVLPGLWRAPADRRVLDVVGAAAAETLGVRRPASAATVAGTALVQPSVQDRAGADAAELPVAARGAELAEGHTLAGLLQLESPVRAVALDVGVLVASRDVQLEVAVRDEFAGTPEGAAVAQAPATLPPPGRPGWARAAFALTLQPVPLWVTVRATRGSAVWLSGAGSGTPVHRLTPGAATWEPAGTGPLALQVRAVTTGDGSLAPVAADAGASAAPAVTLPSGEVALDLGPALTAATPATTVPLRLTACGDGQLTIPPPEVRYSL